MGKAETRTVAELAGNVPPEAPKTKNKGGRPGLYTPELAAEILERIADGETFTSIARDEGMPSWRTLFRWRHEKPDFRSAYTLAREAQMERWGDEIVEIADDATLDTVTKETPQGRTYKATDQENIQRSRLRVDTRKFLMAKIAPQQFGERLEVAGRVDHEHTHSLADASDREKMRRLALFMLQDQAAAKPAIEGQSEPVEPTE